MRAVRDGVADPSQDFRPEHCRQARSLLGWRLVDLSEASGVHLDTVARFERGNRAHARTLRDLKRALEDAGIVFGPVDPKEPPSHRCKDGMLVTLRGQ